MGFHFNCNLNENYEAIIIAIACCGYFPCRIVVEKESVTA